MSESISLAVDEGALTLGDLEDFEEFFGKPLQEAVKPVPVLDEDGSKTFDEKGRPVTQVTVSSKALVGLVWITQRHVREGFTLADARGVRIADIHYTAAPDAESTGNV